MKKELIMSWIADEGQLPGKRNHSRMGIEGIEDEAEVECINPIEDSTIYHPLHPHAVSYKCQMQCNHENIIFMLKNEKQLNKNLNILLKSAIFQ